MLKFSVETFYQPFFSHSFPFSNFPLAILFPSVILFPSKSFPHQKAQSKSQKPKPKKPKGKKGPGEKPGKEKAEWTLRANILGPKLWLRPDTWERAGESERTENNTWVSLVLRRPSVTDTR
jgi:hypothetical protein